MFLCYLDESGVVERANTTSHFVLIGLAIPPTLWREKDAQLSKIKMEHRLFGEVEVHTAYLARRYPEQERISNFATLNDQARVAAVKNERAKDLAKALLRGQR